MLQILSTWPLDNVSCAPAVCQQPITTRSTASILLGVSCQHSVLNFGTFQRFLRLEKLNSYKKFIFNC